MAYNAHAQGFSHQLESMALPYSLLAVTFKRFFLKQWKTYKTGIVLFPAWKGTKWYIVFMGSKAGRRILNHS